MIESDHLVRVVSGAIDKIDLSPLLAKYRGGGTSSYHPQMMLKVLVYAYTQKIYSSRKIAKALRENIHFMWISGENRPDFRTINDFRGSRMKGVIESVFAEVLEYLIEAGKVKLENYFVDGTKIEADATGIKWCGPSGRRTTRSGCVSRSANCSNKSKQRTKPSRKSMARKTWKSEADLGARSTQKNCVNEWND